MLKFGNFNLMLNLISYLHNSNISVTVTCSNTLQDTITIRKHTNYINCGDIASLNIDSEK